MWSYCRTIKFDFLHFFQEEKKETVKRRKRNNVEEEKYNVEEEEENREEAEEEAEEEDKEEQENNKNEEKEDDDNDTEDSEPNLFKPIIPDKILIRAYPSTFSRTVSLFSPAQKEWVINVGFGPLLSFSLGINGKLPHSTICNCLYWFEHKKSQMALSNRRNIDISENDVLQVMGFPKGNLEVIFCKNNERQSHWGSQFPNKQKSRITEKMVSERMAMSEVADDHFKENFMILMSNLFIRTNKTSHVSREILDFEGEFDNAKDYNWCNLILSNLKEAHEDWWADPHKQYYTGCFSFLLVRVIQLFNYYPFINFYS